MEVYSNFFLFIDLRTINEKHKKENKQENPGKPGVSHAAHVGCIIHLGNLV